VFEEVCRRDLEGIVAKLKTAPYNAEADQTTWIKIKNPNYSQAEGRHELFERKRSALIRS
jgi:ATP-dependent DNA ligase